MEVPLLAVCTRLLHPVICAGSGLNGQDLMVTPGTPEGNSTKVAGPSQGHAEPQLHQMLWLAAVSASVSMLIFG
jgi:hypothetical protein